MIDLLKSRLEVIKVDEFRREITSCNGKLLLGRYLSLRLDSTSGVLCIDVVEKKTPSSPSSEISIHDRTLVSEYIEPTPELRDLVEKIELVYYRNPSRTELISVRAYLKREPTDDELIGLYLKLVQIFAPRYLDRTIKIVLKC